MNAATITSYPPPPKGDANVPAPPESETRLRTHAPRGRKPTLFAFNGKTQSVAAWSRELGVPQGTLRTRLSAGRPIDIRIRDEREAWFRRAFDHVPEAWREMERRAVDAFYFRKLSIVETTAELQITRAALGNRLHTARVILAEYRRRIEGTP